MHFLKDWLSLTQCPRLLRGHVGPYPKCFHPVLQTFGVEAIPVWRPGQGSASGRPESQTMGSLSRWAWGQAPGGRELSSLARWCPWQGRSLPGRASIRGASASWQPV